MSRNERRKAEKAQLKADIEIFEAKKIVMDIRGVGRRDGKRAHNRAQRRLDKAEIDEQDERTRKK